MIGVAIECATERAEILVRGPEGERARETEVVGQGHTRRLAGLLERAIERAGARPAEIEWVAADLGPGSFTGVRVGLATAEALSAAVGARVLGASSLSALAHAAPAHKALVVPLVPAGRRESYAGFFRIGARLGARMIEAPRVLDLPATLEAIEEARRAAALEAVSCVGPGASRWREALEAAFPGATQSAWRFDGLSADDLADAAWSEAGPAAGLPIHGEPSAPLYVRSAQAEERVRHLVSAATPTTVREMTPADLAEITAVERLVFADPWPESFFLGELAQSGVYARVAEREGRLAGYSVAWIGAGSGHLGNLAVVPGQRRRGVARALLADLFEEVARRRATSLTLEVRASNAGGQALYRAHGFRLVGLRRGYYRDTGEDGLLMEWRGSGGA